MSLPAGFYRANGPLMAKSPPLAGGPLTQDPWSDPHWPTFLRAAAAPIASFQNPRLEPAGWFMYCGPIELRHWQPVLSSLNEVAFQSGWVVAGEPILVHPHSLSYPWPTFQTRCYGWEWETKKPRIFTAWWDTKQLVYA